MQLAPVGAARIATQDRLHGREQGLIVLGEILMDRQAGAGAVVVHGQQAIIGGHITELDGEEHIDVLLANGLADFLQAGDAVFRRHGVFHLVEPHRAAVGEHLVGGAGIGAVFHKQGDQLLQVRGQPASAHGHFADQLQQVVAVFPFAAVGGVISDFHGLDDGLFAQGEGKEFDVAKVVFFPLHEIHGFLQGQGPGALLEPVGRFQSKTDFADHAQGPDTAAGGQKGVAVFPGQAQGLAVGEDQPQAFHLAGQALQVAAGAVGAGGNGAGQGLQVDIRLVAEAVAQVVGLGTGHGQSGASTVGEDVAVLTPQSGQGFQGYQGVIAGYHGTE